MPGGTWGFSYTLKSSLRESQLPRFGNVIRTFSRRDDNMRSATPFTRSHQRSSCLWLVLLLLKWWIEAENQKQCSLVDSGSIVKRLLDKFSAIIKWHLDSLKSWYFHTFIILSLRRIHQLFNRLYSVDSRLDSTFRLGHLRQ